jgi:type II secretory pathway component PulC
VKRTDEVSSRRISRRARLVVPVLLAGVLAALAVAYWNRSSQAPTPGASGTPRPTAISDATRADAKKNTSPNVNLSLTGITRRGNEAIALIEVERGPTGSYVVGQELAPTIFIRAILADRVVLKYGDTSRTLYLRSADRLGGAASLDPPEYVEGYKERNPDIDPQFLTGTRIATAKEFLSEVTLARNPRGGFVVQRVEPESPYEKLGLVPGDVIYSIDTPDNMNVDDTSMEAAMAQREIQIEVFRNGNLVLLRHRLDQ